MNMKNRMKMLCGGLVVLLASCSSQVTHTNYYFDSAMVMMPIVERLFKPLSNLWLSLRN